MAYQATLNGTQHMTISNQGKQTQITLITSSPGQQQSQSNSFSTGIWVKPPQLFQTTQGFVLQINGEQDQYFISIQGNTIQGSNGVPSLQNASPVKLNQVDDVQRQTPIDFEPMQPMQPMQPMKMGNMSMDINSMSMQMGNMSLNLDNNSPATTSKTFCSQCGTEARKGDRFCRSCGHDLNK